MVKLNRKTELYLIDLGLAQVLSNLIKSTSFKKKGPWNKGKKGLKWTAARRAKFLHTVKKKWAKKHPK